MQPTIIIFDTETASLQGGVCDIAYMALDETFAELARDESLIDPERAIDPGAQEIHGITREMVYFEPTLAEYMAIKNNPLKVEGVLLCGHNLAFDIRIVGAQYLPRSYRVVDTMKLARKFYPSFPNHKLQTVREQLNVPGGTAHRAMGDVETCANVLRHMSAEFGYSVQQLADLCVKPFALDDTMPFGTHAGKKIRNVPKDWCRWLLSKPDVDPALASALKARLQLPV